MVGVVFIHCGIYPTGVEAEELPVVRFVETLFSEILPGVCVPLFFLFAGYLFFAKCEKGSVMFFVQQYKKRFKSLVIPYVFWNIVVMTIFRAMHRFTPQLINPDFENIANFTPPQLLNCFWKGSGGFPIAYQFWFIRDLIVVILFAPIIYFLFAKRDSIRLNRLSLLLLGVLVLLYLCPMPWVVNGKAFVFFTMGATFAMHKVDFVKAAQRATPYLLPLTLCLLLCRMCGTTNDCVDKLYILGAGVIVIEMCRRWGADTPLTQTLSASSFFLFAYHTIVLLFISKFVKMAVLSHNQLLWIAIYFAIPIGIVAVGYVIYLFLSNHLPRITHIVTGGR
jgi:hypothetical protein